jgi:hypothetical protein
VLGHAYSADAVLGHAGAAALPSRKWKSTHMFIERLRATYRWEGEVLKGLPAPKAKSGLTNLELRRPPAFSLPMTGEGQVSHVGERRLVTFGLRRVTNRRLRELGLRFTVRKLRLNAHDEETSLVQAFLRQRAAKQAKGAMSTASLA